jgi:hypothetical protein
MEDDRPAGPGQGAQPGVALRVRLEGVHAPAGPDEGRHPACEQAHRGSDVDDHLPRCDQGLDEAQGAVAAPVRAPQQVQPGRAVGAGDRPCGQR